MEIRHTIDLSDRAIVVLEGLAAALMRPEIGEEPARARRASKAKAADTVLERPAEPAPAPIAPMPQPAQVAPVPVAPAPAAPAPLPGDPAYVSPFQGTVDANTAAIHAQVHAAPPAPPPAEPLTVPQPPWPSVAVPAAQVAVPTAPPPAYTHDQLAYAAAPLMDAGRGAELIALLGRFGVQAVSQLDPAHYGAFADALRAMGAKL